MKTPSSLLFILLLLIFSSCGADLPLNLNINTEREFDEEETLSKLMLVVHNRGRVVFNNVTVTVSNPKNINELYSFKTAKIVSDEHLKIDAFKDGTGKLYPKKYNDFGLVEITCDEGVWSNDYKVFKEKEQIAEAVETAPEIIEKPEQIVNFAYQLQQRTAPTEVIFLNQSEHSEAYIWDFGDGSTAKGINPSHNYTRAGKYNVKLIGIQGTEQKFVTKVVEIQAKKIEKPKPKPKPPVVKPTQKPENKITKLKIVELTIHDFPPRNRNRKNKNWDNALNGNFPDVYYQILSSSGNVFADNRDGRIINLVPGQTQTFYPNYTIRNLNKEYSIRIFDRDDLKADEFMMGFKFKPSAESYQSPTISYKNERQRIHIELKVVWQ